MPPAGSVPHSSSSGTPQSSVRLLPSPCSLSTGRRGASLDSCSNSWPLRKISAPLYGPLRNRRRNVPGELPRHSSGPFPRSPPSWHGNCSRLATETVPAPFPTITCGPEAASAGGGEISVSIRDHTPGGGELQRTIPAPRLHLYILISTSHAALFHHLLRT